MSYAYRYLTAEQRAAIGQRATAPPSPAVPSETLQAAWEADLARHQSLLAAATDEATKSQHSAAITTIEAALTKAAARSGTGRR